MGPELSAADLDYDLPGELVAQHPPAQRGDSRLLVVSSGAPTPDAVGPFGELLLDQLRPDDLVVANDSRVLHARLHLRRPTGGAAEILLLGPEHDCADATAPGRSRWSALARPARRLRPDMLLTTARDDVVRCIDRLDDRRWSVELPVSVEAAPAWLSGVGELPLPPYIRARGHDPERYQPVHARHDGSVAAPTAGLHFTDEFWGAVRDRCAVAHVTLHVGAGTFLPVADGPLSGHAMHGERYEVSATTDAAVRTALAAGRRVVAVGTTTTRVLETVYAPGGASLVGTTSAFIAPGHRFACVGGLLTNFHLPRSTLIALVMAFAGIATTRAAYRQAIADGMRFYSFGDAMFVHGAPLDAATMGPDTGLT